MTDNGTNNRLKHDLRTFYFLLLLSLLYPVTQTHTHKESESHSLLFLHFVGGSEVIKQLAVHLHEGLQHVVDQRHDGPGGTEMEQN